MGSDKTREIHRYSTDINRKNANRNKSSLLFSSAETFKKPLWQLVWTQICESVLGTRCLLLYLISGDVRQYFATDVFSRRNFQIHFNFFLALLGLKLRQKRRLAIWCNISWIISLCRKFILTPGGLSSITSERTYLGHGPTCTSDPGDNKHSQI